MIVGLPNYLFKKTDFYMAFTFSVKYQAYCRLCLLMSSCLLNSNGETKIRYRMMKTFKVIIILAVSSKNGCLTDISVFNFQLHILSHWSAQDLYTYILWAQTARVLVRLFICAVAWTFAVCIVVYPFFVYHVSFIYNIMDCACVCASWHAKSVINNIATYFIVRLKH